MARKIRAICNKLTPAERQLYLEQAMAVINSHTRRNSGDQNVPQPQTT